MKIKLLREVKIPEQKRIGDAGFDLYLPEDVTITAQSTKQIKLGLAIELNEDEVGITCERSGIAIKYGLHTIGNCIDSNYRGEISIIIQNNSPIQYSFLKGERIAQLLVMKLGSQSLEVVDTLSDSERGEKAHLSSGL